MQCNNLLFLAVTKKNSNVQLILFYLYKLTTVRTLASLSIVLRPPWK